MKDLIEFRMQAREKVKAMQSAAWTRLQARTAQEIARSSEAHRQRLVLAEKSK